MEKLIVVVFLAGYTAIAFEHLLKINKAAIALFIGMLCWTLHILTGLPSAIVSLQLFEHLGDIAGIIFFLLGAMTIVELIDAHGGFTIVMDAITATNKRALLWIVASLCFFLSAVLDNLTTTIIMISFISKLLTERKDRLLFSGIIIIAANAGGAWSPIGDVTTTMLWMSGRISSANIILKLLFPSFVCLLVPLLWMTFSIKGSVSRRTPIQPAIPDNVGGAERKLVLFLGVGLLLLVPVFKTWTGLPPFIGMLLALSLLWLVTEIIHRNGEVHLTKEFKVSEALRRIDTPSILFFLGILLAVAALQAAGFIGSIADLLEKKIHNANHLVMSMGFLSAIVDNVPLVSSAIGMYDTSRYPLDHRFWIFLAYCAGTGGSLLSIGSAAGVAAIGMMRIEFFWYVKNIAPLALGGYLAGAAVYLFIVG